MGVSWTKEQQKVIDLCGCNILVSAAAGSGKTAVLVERIITMLTRKNQPVSIDRLLIVTFTEAAAAEMKERIRDAIERKLLEDPDNEHLKQQATLIHNAQITTIHSFCLSVIRDHFHVIDLDPGFRVGEEGELKLLRHDVLEELLEDRYSEADERFLDFVSAYGSSRSDKKIEDLILKIYEYSRSYPDADGWLDGCVQAYQAETVEELEASFYVQQIRRNVDQYLADVTEDIKQALLLCSEPDGPYMYEEALRSDWMWIEKLQEEETYTGLSEKIREIKWMKLAANRDEMVSEDKASQVKALREEIKGTVGDLASQYFYQTPEEMLEDIQLCRPAIEVLVGLTKEFAERFEEEKREKDMIDFSDMEQYAMRILTEKTEAGFLPSPAAREYRQQFDEIMIDEYQDSNLIQETILTSISGVPEGKYNIFMVGDVKQSIYRFRLSRPELFMEKFDTYSTQSGPMQRIDLHKNFRSRPEVLESVNYIFRQIMTKSLGGIVYDEQAALYPGATFVENDDVQTEVLVIDEEVEEARVIAGRIRELLGSQKVVDKKTGELRPVRYGDIVILTRSIRGFVDKFAEILNREGIPTYAGTREGYFSTQEIGVLLDYLRILDNRQQDIPLAAVLTSYFGGLSEKGLAMIKTAYPEVPFYKAVMQYREEGEDISVREKLEHCLHTLDRLREIVPYTPMHELLRRILADTGYEDFVAAMPGGAQRKANLDMLSEKARSFESTSYKGLFHFIRYIEQLQKYNVDYGEASLEDEKSDTVRIMTIHKSKGLEFPVVFVAGMGKRFNMQDARSSAVLHSRLGIGLDAVNLEKRTKSPSLIKRVIQKEEALDSLGEELRVLYVAFTRAREKLIITGVLPNMRKKLTDYEKVKSQQEEKLRFSQLGRANTYWDWILPAFVRTGPFVPVKLRGVTIEDVVSEEVTEETKDRMTQVMLREWDTDQIYEPEFHKVLKEQFAYRYPYEGSQVRKLKFTVSELKKRAYDMEDEESGEILYEEPEVVPLLPRFLKEEEEISGASRGTAYHRLLELLDFGREYDEESLASAIRDFCQKGKMEYDMAKSVRVKDILLFLQSDPGRRMQICASEGKLWKEQPFVLGISAREVYDEEKEDEMLLVQGIIDVYFEEADGLVVLDYKTDKIFSDKELVEKYHAQLDYYAKALEQMTEKKVKEKIIYSFTLQKSIKIP